MDTLLHIQFKKWWALQPEKKDAAARKIAWRAWKAADRMAAKNATYHEEQTKLDGWDD